MTYEPTEFQKKRLIQCSNCGGWVRKGQLCTRRGCNGFLGEVQIKKRLTLEQAKERTKEIKKFRKMGWTFQKIADYYGYTSRESPAGLMRKFGN